MEILKLTLIVVTGIGAIGFFVSWVQAYHKVENIDKWPQQMAALQPWWFLDSKLLPKKYEYIRYKAIKYFVMYLIPLLTLWWLSGN